MDPEQLRAALHLFCLIERPDRREQLFMRRRKRSGVKPGGAVCGVVPGDGVVFFRDAVHEIEAGSAVHMDVDEAGKQISASAFDHLHAFGRFYHAGPDYPPAVDEKVGMPAYRAVVHYAEITEKGFHIITCSIGFDALRSETHTGGIRLL